MTKRNKPQGWPNEPDAHALASRGVKTRTTEMKVKGREDKNYNSEVEQHSEEILSDIEREIKPIAETIEDLGLTGTIYFNFSKLIFEDDIDVANDFAYDVEDKLYNSREFPLDPEQPESCYVERYDDDSFIANYMYAYMVGTEAGTGIGIIPYGEGKRNPTEKDLKKIEKAIHENESECNVLNIFIRGTDGKRKGMVNNIDGGVEVW